MIWDLWRESVIETRSVSWIQTLLSQKYWEADDRQTDPLRKGPITCPGVCSQIPIPSLIHADNRNLLISFL